MATKTHRMSIVAAVIVCVVTAQANVTLFASEDTVPSTDASASTSLADTAPATQTSTSVVVPAIRLPLAADMLQANPVPGASHFTFKLEPRSSTALAGQIYQGRPYRMNHDGSIAALMLGAAATIAGAALLIYANRPDCTTNPLAGGCGYGTKVIGGAVMTGGAVGLFIGALTWK